MANNKNIVGKLLFPFKHNKVFVVSSTLVIALFTTITAVAFNNKFIANTFNTVFGDERKVLLKGDPSKAQYYTKDEGINTKEDALKYANSVNEKICEEGFTLLKNDGALPLKKNAKISVFGQNSVDLVYGGSGSAGKGSDNAIDLYASLASANIDYNKDLESFYKAKKSAGFNKGKLPSMGDIPEHISTGELPQKEYDKTLNDYIADYDDATLVVLSRIGGEGFDLPRNTKEELKVNSDSHYLSLDKNEYELLTNLCAADSKVDNVILIINSSATMELGFIEDEVFNGKIKGALWVGTSGGSGMNALGKILNGEINPSGRTVDTYARHFKNAPSYQNFSTNGETDGNRYHINGTLQNAYFVDYEEGIYVGYRYYETRGYEEFKKSGDYSRYNEEVVYPFGHGLSYTNFEWEFKSMRLGTTLEDSKAIDSDYELVDEDKDKYIFTSINVKNTGDYKGKDVVELYFSAPYINGEIEKSHVVLGGFEKTKELVPNESQEITIPLKVKDMFSYDYNDFNNNEHKNYELDKGNYSITIAKNAHEAWANPSIKKDFNVEKTIVYQNDEKTNTEVKNRFDNVSEHLSNQLSRSNFEGTFPSKPTEDERNVDEEFIAKLSMSAYIGEGTSVDIDKPWYSARKPRQKRKELTQEQAEYQLYQLIGKSYEDPLWDKLLNQLTYKQMSYLIGTGNFNTAAIDTIGKPKTADPDGPAGFTNFMTLVDGLATVYDTCFYASECVIAATFNVKLAYEMGNAIGNESLIGNERGDKTSYSGWYAPAANIHRSPFSDRNWEYYSEDSLLSGKMASYTIKGAKSKGVYTYMKHFALNDQETNRDTNGLITWANEQAMREIYLKPFEIAVKEGETTALMSSFNRIGTVWAGGSYELLTEVLRNEWGFKGMVITDYNTNDYMYADQMIRAGGDLNLIQDKQPSLSGIMFTSSHATAMRRSTKNILYTVVNSNAMNGYGEGIRYGYQMPYWKLFIIGLDVFIALLLVVIGVFAIIRKVKKLNAVTAKED